MNEKKCSKCGEVKPFEEFHKQKNGKYGLASQCKECRKKSKKENKEEVQDNMDEKIMKELIEQGVLGMLMLSDEGKISLQMMFGDDFTFGELQEIQEGVDKIAKVVIDYLERKSK